MKLTSLPVLLAATGLLVGCSQEEELALPAAPVQAVSLDLAGASVVAAPDVSSTAPVIAKAETGQDSADSAATIHHSELVYQRWNDALGDFRKRNGRLPGTLKELEQTNPELVKFRPPAGFKLELHPQFGSIEFAPEKGAGPVSARL